MVTLGFGGYGIEYAISSLSEIEINNIKTLLNRFEASTFIDKHDIIYGDGGKEQYYDYNDIYHNWSVSQDFDIYLITDYEYIPLRDIDDYSFECTDNINQIKSFEQGNYICSYSIEKGFFFTITINHIDFEEFDIKKLKLYFDDLSELDFDVIILSKITYDDINLELDFSEASTTGKGFYQSLIHIDEYNTQYNLIDILYENITPKYNIIEIDDNIDEINVLIDYLTLYNNDLSSIDLSKLNSSIIYHTPLLYDKFDNDIVDDPWYNKDIIKEALKSGLENEIPQHILNRIIDNNADWLI